jgi:hypothetical protein
MKGLGPAEYLNAYVDRRMKYIVEEWDLSRHDDIDDFTGRLYALEKEIPRLKASGRAASEKLTELENRAKRLQEMI